MTRRGALAAVLVASALACRAGDRPSYRLVPSESSIRFVGTKNETVGVKGSFTSLEGAYDKGTAFVQVSLSGTNTGDAARDENIRTHFFEVAKFPLARFEVKGLPWPLPVKDPKSDTVSLDGTLSIHGASVSLQVPVQVTRDEHQHLRVRNAEPLVLSAQALGMSAQLAALKAVCGHQSLADTVPVEVDLAFEEQR